MAVGGRLDSEKHGRLIGRWSSREGRGHQAQPATLQARRSCACAHAGKRVQWGMPASKPWILGLDLSPRSHGALVFAAWMRDGGATVHGLHVLEAWAGPFLAAAKDLGVTVREAVAERYAHLGIAPLEQVEVEVVPRAEDGLLGAAGRAAAYSPRFGRQAGAAGVARAGDRGPAGPRGGRPGAYPAGHRPRSKQR